jgi:hypothetical protein
MRVAGGVEVGESWVDHTSHVTRHTSHVTRHTSPVYEDGGYSWIVKPKFFMDKLESGVGRGRSSGRTIWPQKVGRSTGGTIWPRRGSEGRDVRFRRMALLLLLRLLLLLLLPLLLLLLLL